MAVKYLLQEEQEVESILATNLENPELQSVDGWQKEI